MRLVALALGVCVLASVSCVLFFRQARDAPRRSRTVWVVAAGTAGGCGLWSAHILGMLAAAPAAMVVTDSGIAILLLIADATVMTATLGYSALGPVRWRAVVCSAFGGTALGIVHTLGLGVVIWPGPWVLPLPSQLITLFVGLMFVWAAFSMAFQTHGLPRLFYAGGLLSLGILVMEFVAPGTVIAAAKPMVGAPVDVMVAAKLVAAVAVLVIAVCYGAAFALQGLRSGLSEFGRVLQMARFRQQIVERSEEQLREQHMRLDTALNNMSQGLIMIDRFARLVVCNQRYLDMYGFAPGEAKPGRTLLSLLQQRAARGNFPQDPAEYVAEATSRIQSGKTLVKVRELADGRVISVTTRPMPGGGWVATHEDITEQLRVERRIAYLAHHDVLTGLPNRAAFNERLAWTLDHAATSGKRFAVFFIDLDRFKDINDVFGHSIGDILLCETAQRLQQAAEGHFLVRIGGDEFTLVVADDPEPDQLSTLARLLIEAMTPQFTIDGRSFRISLSIGIALYPDDGNDVNALLSNADAALYRAKAEGRGITRFFEAEMDLQLRERHVLQHELVGACDRGELVLYYQPLLRVNGGVIGFEALVRWQHPGRGMISPDDFIPIAEQGGLIVGIGEWILREACREAVSWPAPLQIAVNLSPLQFLQGDPVELVHQILIDTGLSPQRLQLEITESVLMADSARPLAMLRRLKGLGVGIVMDDFGTGYSSLSYLQSFPFDKIKIDRTFIANVESNHQSVAIVRAIIGLGASLNLPVVAEGVETEHQLAFLTDEHCDEVQGYLLGRPAPITQYRAVVEGKGGSIARPENAPPRVQRAG